MEVFSGSCRWLRVSADVDDGAGEAEQPAHPVPAASRAVVPCTLLNCNLGREIQITCVNSNVVMFCVVTLAAVANRNNAIRVWVSLMQSLEETLTRSMLMVFPVFLHFAHQRGTMLSTLCMGSWC